MFGQFELTDDLGAQQADHVGELGEFEAREDLLCHRRAADDVPALEHHHLLPGPRQVSRGHQAVVPAADDDGVKHT